MMVLQAATRLSHGLVLILAVRAASPPSTTAAAAAPNVSTCQWVPVSQQPILRLGSGFKGASWNDPSSKMSEAAGVGGAAGPQRVMYASAQDMEVQPFQPVKVYRWVSSSLDPSAPADWKLEPTTPVLAPVLPYTGSETPDVTVTKDGVHHLFVTTYQGPPPGASTNFSIGHAISHDKGLSFTLLTSTLVVPTRKPTDWNGDIVGEPSPVTMPNGDVYLYFTAVGYSLTYKAPIQSSESVVVLALSALLLCDSFRAGPDCRLLTRCLAVGAIVSKDNGKTWGAPQQVRPTLTEYSGLYQVS
jgi:hypothetical protein